MLAKCAGCAGAGWEGCKQSFIAAKANICFFIEHVNELKVQSTAWIGI